MEFHAFYRVTEQEAGFCTGYVQAWLETGYKTN